MGWDFYVEVISSRTQARDLCWTFNAVQRLRDAQAQLPVDRAEAYVRPGILWRALDPYSADAYGPGSRPAPRDGVVVLLDEIDKADPDTPNDLLVPLGSGTFRVTDLGRDISRQRPLRPLFLVTTNNERELSKAFMRRCVVLHLPEPDQEWLAAVAAAHYGPGERALYLQVADYVMEVRKQAEVAGERPPSTAEFLDALQACRELDSPAGYRRMEPGSAGHAGEMAPRAGAAVRSEVFLGDAVRAALELAADPGTTAAIGSLLGLPLPVSAEARPALPATGSSIRSRPRAVKRCPARSASRGPCRRPRPYRVPLARPTRRLLCLPGSGVSPLCHRRASRLRYGFRPSRSRAPRKATRSSCRSLSRSLPRNGRLLCSPRRLGCRFLPSATTSTAWSSWRRPGNPCETFAVLVGPWPMASSC